MSWRIAADAREIFVELVATNGQRTFFIRTVNRKDQLTFGLNDAINQLPPEIQEPLKKGEIPLSITSDLHRVSLREQWGSKAAFIATEGFENLLELGNQQRAKIFGLHAEKEAPLIPRELCFGIAERTNSRGEKEKGLDPEEIETIVKKLELSEVKNVALCFLHGKKNGANEKEMSAILKEKGFSVFCSHDETGNELMRARAASQKAFLHGAEVEIIQKIEGLGFRNILSSPIRPAHKGTTSASNQSPANTLYAEFLEDRFLFRASENVFESPISPLHAIEEDEGGLFHGGPKLIDSEPGPVCFGKGLQLTYLDILAWKMKLTNPDIPRLKLDWSKSTRQITPFSQSLRIDAESFVEKLYSLFVESLAVEIETELSSTPPLMVAAGWLGPSLGPALARRLGIKKIFIPPYAGWYGALQLFETELKASGEVKKLGQFEGALPGALGEGEIHDL
jgi:hypothetical protein